MGYNRTMKQIVKSFGAPGMVIMAMGDEEIFALDKVESSGPDIG
jgi:hypothetical protein